MDIQYPGWLFNDFLMSIIEYLEKTYGSKRVFPHLSSKLEVSQGPRCGIQLLSHPIPTWATQKCRLVGDIWLVPYRGYHNGQQRVTPNQKNTLKRQLVLFVFSQGTGMGSSFWVRLHTPFEFSGLAQQIQTSIEGSIGTQDFWIATFH